MLDSWINEQKFKFPLSPSSVIVTPGFGMHVKHLIMTVAPVYRYHNNAPEVMGRTYRNVLAAAKDQGATRISLPSLGTGGMGFPIRLASKIGLFEIRKFLLDHPDFAPTIRIICFEDRVFNEFSTAYNSLKDEYQVTLLPCGYDGGPGHIALGD
jgi:O-acetyl-ADP-ribose deacetylase (regulator of RNase III)